MILGADGSDTWATAVTAGLTGWEQATPSGGIGVRVVATMPGAAGPASSVDFVGFVGCGGTLVDFGASWLRIATPSSVRTHPEAIGTSRLSKTSAVQPNRFTTSSSVF